MVLGGESKGWCCGVVAAEQRVGRSGVIWEPISLESYYLFLLHLYDSPNHFLCQPPLNKGF